MLIYLFNVEISNRCLDLRGESDLLSLVKLYENSIEMTQGVRANVNHTRHYQGG